MYSRDKKNGETQSRAVAGCVTRGKSHATFMDKRDLEPDNVKHRVFVSPVTTSLQLTTAPVGSKNPVLAAIAKRFENLKYDGDKPKLVFVGPEELTTTAAYDAKNHTIKVNQTTKDEVVLWDNILFEAQNARNQSKFGEASKSKGGGSKKTFTEYGKEYASIEYDSFVKYYQELLEIEKEIRDRKKLPDQAQKALAKGDAYKKMPESEAREKFINSPHKKGATGKAGLSSADLYAYESVEGYDHNTLNSRLTNVVRQIYVDMGGLTVEPAQSLKNSYRNFKWPLEPEKRPHALHLVINEVIKTANALKNKHQDKTKLLDSFIVKMKLMNLSREAQKIAEKNYSSKS